jgi:hypothetical protein
MITFHESDFPNAATHCNQHACGFSLYRGVLIQWDEDDDTRILGVLDAMPAGILDRLLIVQEHEGGINFVWKEQVPEGYEEGKSIDEPGGDIWTVISSVALKGKHE